jgi:hypothetical protein
VYVFGNACDIVQSQKHIGKHEYVVLKYQRISGGGNGKKRESIVGEL